MAGSVNATYPLQPVEVPAGSYATAVKQTVEGPATGTMSGMEVREGRLVTISWFVAGVGVVREDRDLNLTLEHESRKPMHIDAKVSKTLVSFTPSQ